MAWVGYWVLLFAVMHLPKPPGRQLVQRLGDKVVHAGAYFVLAMLGAWAAHRLGRRMGMPWFIRWMVIYGAYAATDELLQPLVGRTCQLSDWMADAIGAAAALALAWRLSTVRPGPV
jgi:VanZ family protein